MKEGTSVRIPTLIHHFLIFFDFFFGLLGTSPFRLARLSPVFMTPLLIFFFFAYYKCIFPISTRNSLGAHGYHYFKGMGLLFLGLTLKWVMYVYSKITSHSSTPSPFLSLSLPLSLTPLFCKSRHLFSLSHANFKTRTDTLPCPAESTKHHFEMT